MERIDEFIVDFWEKQQNAGPGNGKTKKADDFDLK